MSIPKGEMNGEKNNNLLKYNVLLKGKKVVDRLEITSTAGQGKIAGLFSNGLRAFLSFTHFPLNPAMLLLLAVLPLTAISCSINTNDEWDLGDNFGVELSIRTFSNDAGGSGTSYEMGTTWENYIDIAGGDFRIYFFTNDKDDATATNDSGRNTLIAEFHPRDIDPVGGTDYTQYNMSGDVSDDVAAYSDFKVVVLANWGDYPTVTVGATTIDALVEGDNTTFSAESFLSGANADHFIPFFGIHEYSGVEWKQGWRTNLSGDITLLRAVAKVEVILVDDSDISGFDSVSIVRYNSSGYCAPAGVYLRGDYDHDYSWNDDFTEDIHLVGGQNDADAGTALFNHLSDTDTDTWTVYLPEYDNTGNDADYSFIRVTIEDTDYEIYFSNYMDGETSSTADYDIFRNCLYRFYVSVAIEEKEINLTIRVHVEKWEACFDNDYVFDVE